METKYPTLRRPKRKLCYITDKESPRKQLEGAMTLDEEVDRMFDDIEPCAPQHMSSLLLQSCDNDTNPSQTKICLVSLQKCPPERLPGHQVGHQEDLLHTTTEVLSPKLNMDLDIPFRAHGPVKTSSPMEHNMDVDDFEKQDNKRNQVVVPVLFGCADERAEEPKKDPQSAQKAHCNGVVAQESFGDDMESPPRRSRITLNKMSSHKKKGRVLRREDNVEPPVLTAMLASEKKRGKVMTGFLEKLKMVVKAQSSCNKKSPVKVPPPLPAPEPEDDFFILEDDAPCWISIPSKSASNRRQKRSRTSSTDKEKSTDKGTKKSPGENPQEQLELGKGNVEQESLTGSQKMKTHEVMGSGNDEDPLPSSEDLPASDLMGQQEPKKKKRQPKKVPSGKVDVVQDQQNDLPSMEKGKDKPSLGTKTKTQKKKGKEMVKRRADKLKEARTKPKESDVVKDVPDAFKEQSPEPAHVEDLASFTDKEVKPSEVDGKTTANKHLAEPGEGSSGNAEDLGRRKRKPIGQWWLSCPQSTEETASRQPTLKKPKAAALSPVKAKKDKVNKNKTNQEPPVPSSSKQTGKGKKSKQTKRRNKRGSMQGRMKASDEILETSEAEQEQQALPDQDVDQQSSPMVFTHREHTTDSGGQIFQKVYHQKMNLAAPRSPKQPEQQLMKPESGKRRRKLPGDWWTVNIADDDLERIHSPPQKPKPPTKKKSAGLGVPKNGNMVIPSNPPEGAATQLQKPLSVPKTVKRSLATFNNIFTSGTATPGVVSSRDAQPAKEVSASDFVRRNRTDKDALSGDAGGWGGTQISQNTPQDEECQSENSRLKVLRSGPSSMIQLEQYEDDNNMTLPSSRVQTLLAVSDLAAPPLKPLSLHPKDKVALTEWFHSLWSSLVDDGVAVTPDQFDWYSYKDRAIGIQADLNSGSICSGKILLGSHMKKPLWVDHSATTVFNLLTGSVSVTINGSVSRYRPGQTFIVECGSAYSIHNSNAQPAVLFFTRIFMESSD